MRKFIDTPEEKVLAIQLEVHTHIGLLVCTLGGFTPYQMVINGWQNGNKKISIKTSDTGVESYDFTKVELNDFILCDFINKNLSVVSFAEFVEKHNHRFNDVPI